MSRRAPRDKRWSWLFLGLTVVLASACGAEVVGEFETYREKDAETIEDSPLFDGDRAAAPDTTCQSTGGGSCEGPGAPGVPTDAGAYRNSRIIWFEWTPPARDPDTVAAYRIQVGTSVDAADLLDEVVGGALAHAVLGKHRQTLYARVAAIDHDGVQGPWSASSDGIEVRNPLLLPATLFVTKSGSDSNDGRTSASPLASIAKAARLAGAGEIIDVGPGIYREQVVISSGGTPSEPLVFRGRGATIDGAVPLTGWRHEGLISSGPLPCRLFSTAFDPRAFPDLLARDGAHHAPTQLFIDGDNRLQTLPMPSSFVNGKALTREQSQDASLCLRQARPGSWWWLDGNHASDRANRVFVCLAPDDRLADHTVEIPVHNTAFSANRGHLQIEGFSLKRLATSGITVLGRREDRDVVIVDNRVRLISGSRSTSSGDLPHDPKTVWGKGTGIVVRVGQQAVIARNTVTDVSYYGIHFLINNRREEGPRPGYLRVVENTVKRITPHPFGVSRAHEGGQAMGGTNGAMYNVVAGNTIGQARYGIWFDSAFGGNHGTGESVVRGNRLFDVEKAIFFERSTFRCTAQRNLVVRAKIAVKLGTGGQYQQEDDQQAPGYQADRCRVVHNTIVDSALGVSLDYAAAPQVKNNIIAAFGSAPGAARGVLVGSATLLLVDELAMPPPAVDHNLYFFAPAGSALGCFRATAIGNCAITLDQWRGRSGGRFGSGSIVANPALRDRAAGDYRLQPWSPALERGVDLGLDDYCGLPDLGAFELATDAC